MTTPTMTLADFYGTPDMTATPVAHMPAWLTYYDGIYDRPFRKNDIGIMIFTEGDKVVHDDRDYSQRAEDEAFYNLEHKVRNECLFTRYASKTRDSAMDWSAPASPDINKDEYVIDGDGVADAEGWFPLGEVSLVAGASGVGKSTWALEMLAKQARGEAVHGRATRKLPYLVLMADRSRGNLRRTLQRLRIKESALPHAILKRHQTKTADSGLAYRIEAQWMLAGKPPVVFIEGLDFLLKDASKAGDVTPVVDDLQALATHYHIAIIGTVGVPKLKLKDGFQNTRENVIGSQAWARTTETIVYINRDGSTTKLAILPRQSGELWFDMKFADGRLEQVTQEETEAKEMTAANRDFHNWVLARAGENFTVAQLRSAFPKMNGKVRSVRLAAMVTTGAIKRRERGSSVFYEVVAPEAITASIMVPAL